jgi:hypothetical protein
MPYILFTLTPLLVSIGLAAAATLVLAGGLPGRLSYFAIATLVALGVHSALAVLYQTYQMIRPVPVLVYGSGAKGESHSDVELFISLFTADKVAVLVLATVLVMPVLVVLKHAMSRGGAT